MNDNGCNEDDKFWFLFLFQVIKPEKCASIFDELVHFFLLCDFLILYCGFWSLAEEKKLVEEVFNNATDCLSDEDKALPQVCWNECHKGHIYSAG